jgi:hypothetical protein
VTRRWTGWAWLLAVLVAAPATASAQGPPAATTIVPGDVFFPSPGVATVDLGWVDHGGVTVTVEPRNRNRPRWQLFAAATAADMGGYGKPVQDILYRVQGAADWTPLTPSAQLVASGSGAQTVTVYFRLLVDWSLDLPGTYSVPVAFSTTTFR